METKTNPNITGVNVKEELPLIGILFPDQLNKLDVQPRLVSSQRLNDR
ncbi:hypothetical protein [Echinicola rosea]|nr:hypothetical protein [Echinicola rosea]